MTSSSPSAAAAAAVAADGAAPTHASPDRMDLDMDANKRPPQQPSPEDRPGETQDSKINDAPPGSTFPAASDSAESKPGLAVTNATPIKKDQPPAAAPNLNPTADIPNQPSTNTSLQEIKGESPDQSPLARPETPTKEKSTAEDQILNEQQGDVPITPLPSNQVGMNSMDSVLADAQGAMPNAAPSNVLGEAAQIVPQTEGGFDAGTTNGELPRPLYTVGPHMVMSGLPNNFEDMEAGVRYSMSGRIPPHATPVQSRTQPATITPQQVFLSYQNTHQPEAPAVAQANIGANKRKNLPCFAKMEFADGTFALTTYEVVIGRDQAAIRKAARNEKRAKLLGHTTAADSDFTSDRRFARSYVSEKGGICGPESESGDEARHKSRSAEGGDAMDVDRKDEESQGDRRYISYAYGKGDAAVDADEVKTAADDSVFLPIHSPGPDIAKKSKGISRRHVKVYYDKSEGVFKIQSIHNNGYFLNDVLFREGPHVLRHGDWLQIKDVRFRFLIDGVKVGCTGAEDLLSKERGQRGGKEMSFDFVSNREGNMRDTSEELSSPNEKMLEDVEEGMQQRAEKPEKKKPKKASPKTSPKANTKKSPKTSPKAAGTEAASPTPADAALAAAAAQPEPNGEARVSLPQAKPAIIEGLPAGIDPDLVPEGFFKKRGPGRPPKNGVMSKRQQRELKKLVEASEKAKAAELPQPEEPIKRKVGRPRKHQLADGAEMPPEKRKATEGRSGSISGGEEKKVKEKKTKAPRIKSPPLQLLEEDYPLDQRQKPSKNYCQMIDEILTPVGREGLTLKQIYKRIAMEWPYFYFNVETKGWESSVRHNLIGNDAFAKDEDRGTWYRRTEISLDAGKKTQKRERSPTLHQGPQIPQGQYYPGSQQPMPHPQNGYMPQQYPQGYPVQNQQLQHMGHPQRPAQYGQSTSPPVAASAQHSVAQHPPFTQASTAARPLSATAQKAPYTQSSQQQHASQFRPTNGAPLPQQPVQKAAQQPGATTGASQSPQPDSRASNPPESSVKAHIEPILVQLLNRTLTQLHRGLSEVKCPNPDEIIWSAVDRALGIRKEVPRDGNFKQMETIAGKGLQDLLDGTIPKYRPSNADGTPAHKTLLHPDTTRHLVSFRDSCITTLKNRFTEEEAVELTNSAITHAFGFTGRPAPTKDLSKRFFEVLQNNVRSMLNRLPSHFRPKEHEALLRGGTPGSRSAATPTPVPASASPAAPAGTNAVPVPQRSPPTMPPVTPQTIVKPTQPQPSAATGTTTYSRPQSQTVMSPPIQGPPPQAPAPASQASATAAAPTPAKPAVPSQPQAPQAQAQAPTQGSAPSQLPAQGHARPQVQATTTSPASATATQAPQPQPDQQKQAQAQGPASTTATSAPTSTIQPAMFRPQVHTQVQTQTQSSTSTQPPSAAPPASPAQAPAPAPPSATQEAQPKPQPQAQTPNQDQVSTQRQPSPKFQAPEPAQQPEVKQQEAQAAQPVVNPVSKSEG